MLTRRNRIVMFRSDASGWHENSGKRISIRVHDVSRWIVDRLLPVVASPGVFCVQRGCLLNSMLATEHMLNLVHMNTSISSFECFFSESRGTVLLVVVVDHTLNCPLIS